MRPYLKWVILIIMIVSAYYTYTFLKSDPDMEVHYITEKAFLGSIVKRVNATGQIRPLNLIDIGAQVSGQIKKIHIKLGELVEKGDALVEIDSSTRQNDLQTSKLKLNSYKAQLLATQTALKTVQLRYTRESRLRKENASSKEAFELVANELATARAAVAEMEALILQAKLAVENAQTDLDYTHISAPKSGIVVAVVVEEGQTVNAVQTAPTLLQIVDLSFMEIKIEISEGDITKVKPGMDVEFNILSEPTRIYNTKLVNIDPAYTIMSNGAYSKSSSSTEAVYYYANALIENTDELLRIGMTVQSSILIAAAKNVVLAPSLAIEKIGDKNFIRVLEENDTIKSYEVVTGLSDGIYTEIKDGMPAGKEIIISQMTLGEISKATDQVPKRFKRNSIGR